MSLHEEQPSDLSVIASTPIQCRISPQVVAQALSQPPFLLIPGALNIRDITISPYVRKGFIYRSGALSHLSQSGKSSLSGRYGIETIFDLRTRDERDRGPSPIIEGIATVWTTNSEDTKIGGRVLHKINPKDFVEEDGKIGYLKMYTNILDSHKDAFKTVLLHLRDQSHGGILFHCTAGRDRTGVLAALILGIAGAPPDAIAIDYALTRIGIEPAHEQLLATFQAQSGFAVDEPGFVEMCSTQAKTMLSFLNMLEEKWGGVEGYVREELDIGDGDLERIRNNLRERSNSTKAELLTSYNDVLKPVVHLGSRHYRINLRAFFDCLRSLKSLRRSEILCGAIMSRSHFYNISLTSLKSLDDSFRMCAQSDSLQSINMNNFN